MRFKPGMVGVITGAGSGFGRELALQLAGRGLDLGLCDVDAAGLAETAAACRAKGSKVTTASVDVRKKEEVFTFASLVEAEHGHVHYCAANAGIVSMGGIMGEPLEVTERILDVNVRGVLYTAKAFLPLLVREESSCIMIVSSVAGLAPSKEMVTYSTSKFAVRGFSESLQLEMHSNHPNVQVTTIHPGFCKTNIFKGMSISPDPAAAAAIDKGNLLERFQNSTISQDEVSELLSTVSSHTAASAAECMLRGVERGATRVLITPEAHILDLIVRCFPRLSMTAAGKLLGGMLTLLANGVGRFTPLVRPGVLSLGWDRAIGLLLLAFLAKRKAAPQRLSAL